MYDRFYLSKLHKENQIYDLKITNLPNILEVLLFRSTTNAQALSLMKSRDEVMDSKIYKQAEQFLPWNLQQRIFNSTIFPYWTSQALYYFHTSKEGKKLIRVDIQKGEKEQILDFHEVVDALAKKLNQAINEDTLPLDRFSMQENPRQISFPYQKKMWNYDILNKKLVATENTSEYLKSPDGNLALQVKDYNLFLVNLAHNKDFQITTDGEQYYDYASSPETNTHAISQRLSGQAVPPIGIWSPDSRKIITHKLDQRNVEELHLLQNAPAGSQRTKLHTYRMSFSGDECLPLAELMIVDVDTKSVIPIKVDPMLSPYLTPIEFGWVWWSEDGKNVYFLQETRGSKELIMYCANTDTGTAEILIHEKGDTYVEPSSLAPWPRQIIVLKNKIIWLSQSSGYSHLYLYNLANSDKNAITSGEWNVRELHFYDEAQDWLYFTACGYDKNIDPYFKMLFRCHLNGTDLQCLTQENAHHVISISPGKNCFLDTWSTIDKAPITVLKAMDGKVICHIETADIEGLHKLNWVAPKRFKVTARDGKTPIYGNLYFPSYFDPSKKYPIIDHIYPGPQFYRTPPYFNLYGAIFRSAWIGQALAELGFIVIHVDGLGTPGRSKEIHDASYEMMGDCGIPDHITAIQQLAKEYSFIDLEKVGITGYSGGGYAAARAILMYPDFYKVAVSAAGNHDLRCYPASYGEKYNGLDTGKYEYQSNAAHAEKLQGKLLLIHGEMDDNVHPCATMQLVDALIRHNKDFDMLIMPNQNHATTFDHPYYWRKHWDYFVQNLQSKIPPKQYLIKMMPDEFPQLIDW